MSTSDRLRGMHRKHNLDLIVRDIVNVPFRERTVTLKCSICGTLCESKDLSELQAAANKHREANRR